MAKYQQGFYRPQNPEKYKGDANNIKYRSSWELRCMRKFDTNPNVLEWASEELVIIYRSPLDGKKHRYYPDFIIRKRGKDGLITTLVIEIKPDYQTRRPIKTPKMREKRFLVELATWAVNEAKWKAAKAHCTKKGVGFAVLTEKHLGIK